MPTSLLVVTPSPSFGEQIRQPLEETGSYRVHVVNSKAAAIVRADEESCGLAFLDLDLGETWVIEVGESLRTIIPNIKLFILAGDETPPAFDSIRPWTLIRKPFQLPEVLQTIGAPADVVSGLSSASAATRDLLWLSDVNKAAQHLTRLTLESSSQAALITRSNVLWAYAGQLSQAAAQEVAKVLSRTWDSIKSGDLLRFVRLESTKAEHMLYATQLGEGMLLAMVFDAETPFSTIRSQAGQLATSLAEGETPEEPALPQEKELEAAAPPMAEMEDEEDGMELPSISEILKDIPIPDPHVLPASHRVDVAPSIPSETSRTVLKATTVRKEPAGALGQHADPDATRPSIFSRESSAPMRLREDSAPSNLRTNMASSTNSLDETVVSKPAVRPETPVRVPLPGELDETRQQTQTRAELPSSDLNVGPIVMEPISAGVYHLAYACLLVPRMASHYLTGDMADKVSEWLPIICVAFGWRLEYLAVRPEYLQWVANVPPATSPGYLMRVMRQQISDKIFASFPRLKRDNPSGDFWAPGYLIMGGTQPHPPQLVKDYIKQIRQRQGIEKPAKRNPRS
jgi:REP element-mobilizing transposase RayT